MKISSINQKMSFKNLYYSNYLQKKRQSGSLEPETKQILKETLNSIRKNKLHHSKQLDLILSVDEFGDLKAIISDKEQGTPYNPGAILSLSITKPKEQREKSLVSFFRDWEEAYSSEGLSKMKQLQEFILEAIRKKQKSNA